MDALDGNAVAGALLEHYGRDMTTALGMCRMCGARAQLAEQVVYARAPAAVMRCRSCGAVLMVLATIHESLRVTLEHLRLE